VARLDHLTVVAPTLVDGVGHVRACLGIEVPFGTRHPYMGTHNHRLRLGDAVYLEIIAADPGGTAPAWPRWFGLDDRDKVLADWASGRRLRYWVASTVAIPGAKLALPGFDFGMPADDGLPALIDRHGAPPPIASIPDFGARLRSFTLEHPRPAAVAAPCRLIVESPDVVPGPALRYRALIETPSGLKELT
jgi:hypothetical protein